MALTGLLMAASRVAGGVAKGRREGEGEAYTRREAEARRAFDEWSKRRQLQQQDAALSQKAEIETERLTNQRTLRDMQDKAAAERAGLQREVDMFRARGQFGREGDQQATGLSERIATERNTNQREMNDADNQTAIRRAMIAAAAAQARAANESGKRPTEGESKDYLFYNMLRRGRGDMESVAGKIRPEAVHAYLFRPVFKPALTPEEQVYVRGAREFAAGALRKETGAAFGKGELEDVFARYIDTALDAPGMSAAKRKARAEMEETFRRMSSRAAGVYDGPTGRHPQNPYR